MTAAALQARQQLLSYSLVEPFDWFQLRAFLWEAFGRTRGLTGYARWSRIAEFINERCPQSQLTDAATCEKVAKRLIAAVPDAPAMLQQPDMAVRAWNHLLYSIASQRFGAPPFMNLGYWDLDGRFEHLTLQQQDEANRLFIQLYECTVRTLSLTGLDVVEVGCGAGGGADYLFRYHKPRSLHGIDLVDSNIAACQRLTHHEALRFSSGAAEKLPLPDRSADVIVNVESSFTYEFEEFLQEVRRVLRPGGQLLLTDHRPIDAEWGENKTLERMREQLRASQMRMLRDEDITANVVAANELLAEMKRHMLLEQRFSVQDQAHFSEIMHCAGSANYERLRQKAWEYRSFALSMN